ncbi:heme peroxidase [Lentinus tigrinus ALCF2SS1-7]|uniref:Peroxidase n=1 Tax=Lentinus tigrinus ALCF2SS1-6 TaxID=1328759 RepID=A0A5C2RYK1_9APHY|nr:heme peroxidase [Lentinus tigrinus ALCF2SS1-6]RPD73975.1 heme peroxidase [Lentinus tigrinus ALCF2SS1-7]
MFSKTRLSSLLFLSLVSAYTWPDPKLDELESQIYDLFGYNFNAFPGFPTAVNPCTLDFFDTGAANKNRSNAADWIRTAYHDMATYNTADGTGGLDGSIQYEQDRAENVGDGFNNTIRFFQTSLSRYLSVADSIAIAAKIAIEVCGGPDIPFRGGRIDATGPNNPGVPEPQQDLASHTAAFKRQGFNPTEMITLVACGHSFGGVQHSAFPDTVPLDDGLDDESLPFDSTPFTFDNTIAVEYIQGTTRNPLVVGANDTTNSDKRIFASDGNVTMKGFAEDPESFKTACASQFANMLNQVPSDVQLSEVIEPLPVKPQLPFLLFTGDGTLQFSGQIRFWNMSESSSRTIKLLWADRSGNTDASYTGVLSHASNWAGTNKAGQTTALWYKIGSLNQTQPEIDIDEETGISKFWFEVDEGDGSAVRTEDQNGAAFVLQDAVMLADSTCNNGTLVHIDIAVRSDANPSRVYVEYDVQVPNGPGTIITVDTADAALLQKGVSSTYDLWTVDLPKTAISTTLKAAVNIAADIGGNKVTTSYFRPFVGGQIGYKRCA